jgi:hypothetical protein
LAQCLRTPPVARRLRALLRTRLIRQTPLLPPLGGGGCHALRGASTLGLSTVWLIRLLPPFGALTLRCPPLQLLQHVSPFTT